MFYFTGPCNSRIQLRNFYSLSFKIMGVLKPEFMPSEGSATEDEMTNKSGSDNENSC